MKQILKRTTAIILLLSMLLSAAACSENTDNADDTQADAADPGDPVDLTEQVLEAKLSQIPAPGSCLDAGQYYLAASALGEGADLGHHVGHGFGADGASCGGDGAVGATGFTAVLDLDVGAGSRGFGYFHRLKFRV